MISLIADLPGNILGFRASGIVTGEDYEKVLVPALEEKLGEVQKVHLLYQLDEGFEKFDLGAMWEDAKVGL